MADTTITCPCGREITRNQYCVESDEDYAERLRAERCRAKCKRLYPAKAERQRPSIALTQQPVYEAGEGVCQPKETPWRSKPYRDFIKALPCCIPLCGKEGVDPHHEQEKAKGGMATTPGDDRCVPLCRDHHDVRQHGPLGRKIWAVWGVMNIERVILALNEEYMRQGHQFKKG